MTRFAAAGCLAFIVAGCDTKESSGLISNDPVSLNEVGEDIGKAADSALEYASDATRNAVSEISDGFDSFQEKVAELNAKAEERLSAASESVQVGWKETQRTLARKQEEFVEVYEKFNAAGGDASEELQEGLATAWDELKAAYETAADRLEELGSEVSGQ